MVARERCIGANVSQVSEDPTLEPSRWQGLRELLAALDAEVARVYPAHGVEGMAPRFAYPMIRLAHRGPLGVGQLAAELGLSQPAVSQTVKAMRERGFVETRSGPDARTRTVELTGRGRELVPLLEAEWRATEAAVAELDDEIPYALSRVVADLERVLATRSMYARIRRHLDA